MNIKIEIFALFRVKFMINTFFSKRKATALWEVFLFYSILGTEVEFFFFFAIIGSAEARIGMQS